MVADDIRLGRFRENDDASRAGRVMFKSGRVGSLGGRPARTFHCCFGSVTAAKGVGRARSGLAYIERAEEYERRRDELELVGGSVTREELGEALEAIDAGVRVRRGPTAERVVETLVFEFPAASTGGARKDACERIQAWFEEQGQPCRWAIHHAAEKGDGRVNVHAHFIAAARRVSRGPDGWLVDRKWRPRVGMQSLRDARKSIADAINTAMTDHGVVCEIFHPGRLKDVGISRQAKRRVPARAYHRQSQLESDPEEVTLARRQHEDEREDAKRRKEEKAYQKERRLAKAGFVPAEHLAHVRQQRDSVRRELARRDAEARTMVQVVKEVPVYLEPPEEQRPATAKAVKTMMAMASERGLEIDDEAPMTVGTVGATIRHLMSIPRPGVKPMSTSPVPPSPPTPKANPLRIDPAATAQDCRRILRDMSDDHLVATYRVSHERYNQVKQLLANGGRDMSLRRELLELDVAGGAMSSELVSRGLMSPSPTQPKGPSPNTRQRGREGESR